MAKKPASKKAPKKSTRPENVPPHVAIIDQALRAPDDLLAYPGNAREHPEEQVDAIAHLITRYGWTSPIALERDGKTIIAGHGRLLAAKKLGLPDVPTITLDLEGEEAAQYRIADNMVAGRSHWNLGTLEEEIRRLEAEGADAEALGMSEDGLADLLKQIENDDQQARASGSLAAAFGVPPFSVLNARLGWWQERKSAWISLGIDSELGRGENLLKFSKTAQIPARKNGRGSQPKGLVRGEIPNYDGADRKTTGTSVFDPVLCELAYRWFCPPGGSILDPFAGGSVRGIVASRLGRPYLGIDLRADQVQANEAQLGICRDPKPRWIEGDAIEIPKLAGDFEADFLFSCPPYADLEQYSEDPRDLSTMEYDAFRAAYFEIIRHAADRLKANRFACFVVGEVRDPRGAYRGFVPDTIEAFRAAGLEFYNEAILITATGSLAIRARKQFEGSRKLGKSHKNVLVFVKGDAKKATEAIGRCQFGEIEDPEDQGGDPAAKFGEVL